MLVQVVLKKLNIERKFVKKGVKSASDSVSQDSSGSPMKSLPHFLFRGLLHGGLGASCTKCKGVEGNIDASASR